MIKLKRVYENKEQEDGQWILVERLWPRGIRKEKIDLWFKDVAPSSELRVWFSHDPDKWDEFKRKYTEELKGNSKVNQLATMARTGNITLVYAASDIKRNSAVVLKDFIENLNE